MSSVIGLSILPGSASNCLRHMPSLRTTTGAAPRSPSLGSSVRPSRGFVSKTEKKFWVTTMVLASDGSPRPVSVREWLARPAMALKARLLSRNSSRLGYDIHASVQHSSGSDGFGPIVGLNRQSLLILEDLYFACVE